MRSGCRETGARAASEWRRRELHKVSSRLLSLLRVAHAQSRQVQPASMTFWNDAGVPTDRLLGRQRIRQVRCCLCASGCFKAMHAGGMLSLPQHQVA